MCKVLAFLADGLEEVECLSVVDVLRRAEVDVTMVSVTGRKEVTGSHGISILTDALFEQVDTGEADVLFLPGGMPGTTHLKEHSELAKALESANREGRRIAAICAAPTILAGMGITDRRRAVCYPGMEEEMGSAVVQAGDRVVVDGRIVTGEAAGSAFPFGLKLVEVLRGKRAAEEVCNAVHYHF